MERENIILQETFDFAVKIVKLSRYLKNEKREYDLSTQLLKSGTSIGANCEEGNSAQSKKDFISKMGISLKEAKETRYWLRLLAATGYISYNNELFHDIDEIISILVSILKTSKEKI